MSIGKNEEKRRAGEGEIVNVDPPCTALVESNRRFATRTGAEHNAMMQCGGVCIVVELGDVSDQGAQIAIRDGFVPNIGQRVALRFMNQLMVDADVVWAMGTRVGLQFTEGFADHADIVHFDDLGADFFSAVLRYQIARE